MSVKKYSFCLTYLVDWRRVALYLPLLFETKQKIHFLGAGNYQMFVDENLDVRQPFKLCRYGKNRKFTEVMTENFRL